MEYKGYQARVEFDQEARVLFGEVEGLRDVVTFQATNVKDLERAFQGSVDDYLAMCAERNEEPEKPYSGKFLVRVDPMLHRDVARAAARAGMSLNAFAGDALRSWLQQVVLSPREQRPVEHLANASDSSVQIFETPAEPSEAAMAPSPRDRNLELWVESPQNTPGRSTPAAAGTRARTPDSRTPGRKVA